MHPAGVQHECESEDGGRDPGVFSDSPARGASTVNDQYCVEQYTCDCHQGEETLVRPHDWEEVRNRQVERWDLLSALPFTATHLHDTSSQKDRGLLRQYQVHHDPNVHRMVYPASQKTNLIPVGNIPNNELKSASTHPGPSSSSTTHISYSQQSTTNITHKTGMSQKQRL